MSLSFALYTTLAPWWPLMSPPQRYAREARLYHRLLTQAAGTPPTTILELGSGGGHLAHHLPGTLTLVDQSAEMLAISQALNPQHRHVQADMRTLDLGDDVQFDAVLLHDAVMYLTTEADLRATFEALFRHCRPGGAALILPDVVAETFAPFTTSGGEDGADGRGLRMLEWHWDPDPHDHTFQVDFSILIRDTDGRVQNIHEAHTLALFPRSTYWRLLRAVGFTPVAAEVITQRETAEIFLARRPG